MEERRDQAEDPLIDEVRARRMKLFARCGNTIHGLIAKIQSRQAVHPQAIRDPRRRKALKG